MAEQYQKSGDTSYTLQGRELTYDWLMAINKSDMDQSKNSHKRTLDARAMRRKEKKVTLAPTWITRYPETAAWVTKILPQRRTYERDLIAAVGAVEPSFSREATGYLDRDRDYAEEYEGFLEEWRKAAIPFQTFVEKGVEDGPYAVAVLPSEIAMDGCPDFYQRLEADAWAALSEEEQAEYQLDETDLRKRYAKTDDKGRKTPDPKWDRDKNGSPRKKGAKDFERDDEASQKAHEEAVQRYLLKIDARACDIKVIPALDCAPALTRGKGRRRWELHHLSTRELFYPEDLPMSIGWRGMGDMALIPQGYRADRTTGQHGQWYLYTLYYVWTDPKTRIKHPLICYTVGGLPTWMGEQTDDSQRETVAVIDLYKTHGLQGAFWDYFGGMHTSDDDPDWYYEPAITPIIETILQIEGVETSIAAATSVNAYTGHFSKPDAALAEVDPEAMVDAATGNLRKTKIPLPGEIEDTVSTITAAVKAEVGADAWRLLQSGRETLAEATSIDQPQGAAASGHAQVVDSQLSLRSKRQIREGALEATIFCAERASHIWLAAAEKFGVKWPQMITKERPVGSEFRTGEDILAFDPAWIGDSQLRLVADYPPEANPLQVQMAEQAYEAGTGTLAQLAEAKGIKDVMSFRAELAKDRLWRQPATDELLQTRIAKRSGNKLMLEVLKLQQQQKMTQQGPPGFDAGVPTSALKRPGESSGGSGQNAASQSLAGAKSGYLGRGPANADVAAAMQIAPQQGAA